jgi:hypothetical protein
MSYPVTFPKTPGAYGGRSSWGGEVMEAGGVWSGVHCTTDNDDDAIVDTD